MKRAIIESLIEKLINLNGADWRTVRRHETRILKNPMDEGMYFARAANSQNMKNYSLLTMASHLVELQKTNTDCYNQIIVLVVAERAKLAVPTKRHSEEHYKAKRALYARRWRAKKAGRPDMDDAATALKELQRKVRFNAVGVPKPKSLTHAQQMKAELDRYIAEEERVHGGGNVSTPLVAPEYDEDQEPDT